MAKVKHVVLIRFKQGSLEEHTQKFFNEILDATESIPGIEDYVSGPNSSPEGLAQGYTHALIITFTDSAARDAYLANPENERIRGLLASSTDSLLVFDFEV